MDKLDGVVIDHIEREFLDPSRLEIVLSALLDRRQERSERRREHIAEPNKRSAETELRLKRLYDAIEAGVADLDDPALKGRIDGLRAIRDQAKADSERAQAMLESSTKQAITPQMVERDSPPPCASGCGSTVAATGAITCAPLPSASRLPSARCSSKDRKTSFCAPLPPSEAETGVPSSVLKWRRRRDSNPR
jgi:site-specific DNA recombinase